PRPPRRVGARSPRRSTSLPRAREQPLSSCGVAHSSTAARFAPSGSLPPRNLPSAQLTGTAAALSSSGTGLTYRRSSPDRAILGAEDRIGLVHTRHCYSRRRSWLGLIRCSRQATHSPITTPTTAVATAIVMVINAEVAG